MRVKVALDDDQLALDDDKYELAAYGIALDDDKSALDAIS